MSNIVVIDHGAHPSAAAYYRLCTYELTGTSGRMALGGVFPIQNLTLGSLMDKIIAELPDQNGTLVLACHGNPEGLIIPMITGDQIKCSRDALNLISSGRPASAVASPLGLTEGELNGLRTKMDAVRAKSLDRIEIRGCRVGQRTTTMEAIQRFLGAANIGAPTVFNAWSTCNPNSHSGSYDYTRYDRETNGYHATIGNSGHLGFIFDRRGQTSFRLRNVRATSSMDVKRWAVQAFPIRLRTMITPAQGPAVPQYRDLRQDVVDPDPYDDVPSNNLPIHMQLDDDDNLIMPNSATYRTNLEEISGLRGAFDPNDPLSGL